MIAALLLVGTSVAAGAFLELEPEDGDSDGQDGADDTDLHDAGLDLLRDDAVDAFEILVADAPDAAPPTADASTIEPLVSEAPGMVTMIGEAVTDAFGLDAPGNLSPITGEGGLEETGSEAVDAPEDPAMEGVVRDADIPEGSDVLEWNSAEDPVEITDFVPGEDLLAITIIAEHGIDGVDVEISPSADGMDGEVRANDQLLAVIRGAPDIEPDAFQFDLVEASEQAKD